MAMRSKDSCAHPGYSRREIEDLIDALICLLDARDALTDDLEPEEDHGGNSDDEPFFPTSDCIQVIGGRAYRDTSGRFCFPQLIGGTYPAEALV